MASPLSYPSNISSDSTLMTTAMGDVQSHSAQTLLAGVNNTQSVAQGIKASPASSASETMIFLFIQATSALTSSVSTSLSTTEAKRP